ncbi:MAG: delta-60 repeat domain-containing protein [Solirubrobacterales bacterium]|nr:delta-60 repeat domain-containing protein [Solirubrobacterales bacterium]
MLLLRSAPRSAARRFAVGFLLPAVLLLSVAAAPDAQATQRIKVNPGFNGTVSAVAGPDANGVTYLGGTFSAYNALDSGRGALVSTSNGTVNTSFPKVSGGILGIQAVASDGSGGYYIGGDFTSVDGTTRNRAAHINSDGSLDASWDPNLSGSVSAIAVSGSSVYLGGSFNGTNSVNGSANRNRAAKVNTTNGTVDASWNPNLNNQVSALVVSGSSVYLGGNFSGANSVNGNTTRNRAAKVDTTNGTVDASWNPNVGNGVFAIAVSGSSVYLGGSFSGVNSVNGSATRNRAAKVDTTNGTVDSFWDPNVSGIVRTIAVSGSSVYLGGSFSGVNSVNGSATRNRAAKVDATNGTVDSSWNPNLKDTVYSIAVDGSSVYVGGSFNGAKSVNGTTTRNNVAKVDTTNGTVDGSWNPNPSSTINALVVSGSSVYLGGASSQAGGVVRNSAAAIDSNGALTSWNPNLTGSVLAIAVDGSSVYLGGDFNGANSVNGNTLRNRAAKVDTTNGTVDASWDPNISNQVFAIAVSGSSVYLGGIFNGANSVNGTTIRNNAAKFNTTDGTVDSSWNPNISSSVLAIAVDGSSVYLGGQFSGSNTVNGNTTRNNAAKVDTTNGTVDSSWNPNLNNTVWAIVVDGSSVYLGGDFSGANSVNGTTTRNRAAKVNTTNGTVTSWDPNLTGTFYSLAVDGGSVYLGGAFTGANSVNGTTTRNRAAKVDTTNGTVDASWNPNLNNNVFAIAVSGSSVYLGGSFNGASSVNGTTTRNRTAAVDTTNGTVDSWATGMKSPTLDTSAATLDRGTTVKGDASTPTGSTPGSYKWQRCTSSSAADCSDINTGAGTTGAWWGSRNADIGNRVRLKAVWDTIDATTTAYSALTGLFSPVSTVAPSIDQGLVSGAPKVGTNLHSTFGTWSGYRAGLTTVTFQWQRCTTIDASSCTTNVGTNSQWYKPVAADAGNYLRVTATLTTGGVGAGGGTQVSATASSTLSGPVASNLSARRMTARTAVSKPKVTRKAAKR